VVLAHHGREVAQADQRGSRSRLHRMNENTL
jgi:hypothetical protein